MIIVLKKSVKKNKTLQNTNYKIIKIKTKKNGINKSSVKNKKIVFFNQNLKKNK